MFVPMKNLLIHACEHQYAVMAINSVNMESTKAIIQAAQEEHSAAIINVSPRQMHAHAHGDILTSMVKEMAKKVNVPIALSLDHGGDYEDLTKVMEYGFSSVMIDASGYELEENIHRTATIATLAHAMGLSVEGELGHVGMAKEMDNVKADLYTNPAQAKEFVERTGVDCLAVAIGTAHGSYPGNFIPKLDFERLKVLKDTLKMPLVLHGGSGAGPDNIRKAVQCGINKINVCTDVFIIGRQAMVDAADETPCIDYMDICISAQEAMKKYIKDYMQLIGSSGQYTFGKSTSASLD